MDDGYRGCFVCIMIERALYCNSDWYFDKKKSNIALWYIYFSRSGRGSASALIVAPEVLPKPKPAEDTQKPDVSEKSSTSAGNVERSQENIGNFTSVKMSSDELLARFTRWMIKQCRNIYFLIPYFKKVWNDVCVGIIEVDIPSSLSVDTNNYRQVTRVSFLNICSSRRREHNTDQNPNEIAPAIAPEVSPIPAAEFPGMKGDTYKPLPPTLPKEYHGDLSGMTDLTERPVNTKTMEEVSGKLLTFMGRPCVVMEIRPSIVLCARWQFWYIWGHSSCRPLYVMLTFILNKYVRAGISASDDNDKTTGKSENFTVSSHLHCITCPKSNIPEWIRVYHRSTSFCWFRKWSDFRELEGFWIFGEALLMGMREEFRSGNKVLRIREYLYKTCSKLELCSTERRR